MKINLFSGKAFVLGRKSWLFAGSEDGARSSCLLFTLIECAKIHNINPEDYLRCIFEQAADTDGWTEDDWKNLLPWNIKITSFEPQGVWIAPQGAQNWRTHGDDKDNVKVVLSIMYILSTYTLDIVYFS